MSHLAVSFLLFLATIKSSYSLASNIEVISGVFVTPETNQDYENVTNVCKSYDNSAVASIGNVETALQNGFEKCTWGWVKEEKMLMPRKTANEKCANSKLGIVIKNCSLMTSNYVICIKANGTSENLYEASIENQGSSFFDANLACIKNGDNIASWSKINAISNHNLTTNRPSWYNYGVAFLASNGSFFNVSCYNGTQGAVYCYNPNLPDTVVKKSDTTWKRIAIGCVLGSIFVVLLLAGIFMKGNQCICCVKEKPAVQTDFPSDIVVPAPTWNKTSMYTPMRKDSKYANVIFEKRPPVIRPDLSYKIHTYENMGYDTRTDE